MVRQRRTTEHPHAVLAPVPLTHPNTRRSTTIFRKNKPSEVYSTVTIEDDVNAGPHADLVDESGFAAAIAGSAVFSFELAANDLEDAARRQGTIAALAEERIEQLIEIRDYHQEQADQNMTVACRLRRLVSVSKELSA